MKLAPLFLLAALLLPQSAAALPCAETDKDCAQAAINFCVFATMAFTSFASGALVTTQGWTLLNMGSILPVALIGLALLWLALRQREAQNARHPL